jgi:hypothetical protein
MSSLADVLPDPGPGSEVQTISNEDLERIWSHLVPDNYSGRRGLDVFLDAVQAGAGQEPGAELQFRPGGWQVSVQRAAVQAILAAALIAGLLVVLGASGIPPAVVTAVIPLLFDVQRVTLSPGEKYLLAELVGHREALDGTLTARQLYGRLDAETQSKLSFPQFLDFIATCRQAGLADTSATGTVTVRSSDDTRFRITFR